MGGRLVDVDGVSPEGVLIGAATSPAYADEPWERLVMIAGWIARDECTRGEVVSAVGVAREYLAEDADDYEAAQAVVVLEGVLRATDPDLGRGSP